MGGKIKNRADLVPGDLILYPFRWARDDARVKRGQVQDPQDKMRPCIIVSRGAFPDGTPFVAILPITTRPIRDLDERTIVPMAERSQVGMNPDLPQSVVLIETNVESLDVGSNIAPRVKAWAFSPAFRKTVERRFKERMQAQGVIITGRRKATQPKSTPKVETGLDGVEP